MSTTRTPGVAMAVGWRAAHNYLRDPSLLIPSMIFPLFFFAAFAGGLSTVNNTPGFQFPTGYVAFQYVYVLLQAVIYGGVFTGVSIAIDLQSGFTRRFMLAAPNRLSIIIGYVLFGLVRGLVPAIVLTAVALITGMHVDGGGLDIGGLIAIAILANVASSLWGLGLALRIRSAQAAPLLQMLMFIVLFLAPVYVPLKLVSGWIHALASLNPITLFLESGRGFISGEHAVLAAAFLVGGGLIVLLALWAQRGLRQAERVA
jgi:ABC-2 type transport system permease protein